MRILQFLFVCFLFLYASQSFGQEVTLFQQFNGRYDYVAIGNTLNPSENNLERGFCETLPSSQAELNLDNPLTIVAAYLYWAGSGEADTSITLNETSIDADIIYTVPYVDNAFGALTYFSCYADVTDLIRTQGNSIYELSDLDISEALITNEGYCGNRTNFAGWAMYVIYEDNELTLNQINLFQGLDIINRNVEEKLIVLENLNVIDNENAKIGFLAWEGDDALNYGETLSINGNILSNPPLNFANNAFNGTNTFTNSNTFYNGDLDVYNIQDNIQIGDTDATIRLTTGGFDPSGFYQADLIIINNIITVLNSQLPDATIVLNDYYQNCNELEVTFNYKVSNTNSTDMLPAGTPIAFYIDEQLIGQSTTQSPIEIGGFENGTITLPIPVGIVNSFELVISVDDDGSHVGLVTEIVETNNTHEALIDLLPLPAIDDLPSVLKCNEGFDSAVFNLMEALPESIDPSDIIGFYETQTDLEANQNEVFFPEGYTNMASPQTIYVKLNGNPCFEIYRFELLVENCPPKIPEGFSPTDDQINDWFNIQGLYDIFLNHRLIIYNRYGTLIFEGNNSTIWDGKANRGLNNLGKLLPTGTYYYILYLNDPKYQPMQGWVYMKH